MPADTTAARTWIGSYRAPAGALPYGEGPFAVEREATGQAPVVMLRPLWLDREPVKLTRL